jgi:hypothetical protein
MEKFKQKPIPSKFPGVIIHTSGSTDDFNKEEFMKLFKYEYDKAVLVEKSVPPVILQFDAIKIKYITIGEEKTKKRKLAAIDVYSLPPSSDAEYILPNRHYFTEFIRDKMSKFTPNLSQRCEDLNDALLVALPHQKLVRSYINLETPYRGLLLYHGLGSGKTCSSILISEGIKEYMNVVVMTPKSLRSNYVQELKKCGDSSYSIQQHWEWNSDSSNPVKVKRNKYFGAWEATPGEPNFEKMSAVDQASIVEQIDKLIETKYNFIHYNGLNKINFNDKIKPNGINVFSNKLVVIDEAHNLISKIVNKLNKPEELSYQLYELLMNAENCKIVLLTGTPIINYSYEAAILFNILRGTIPAWSFSGIDEAQLKMDFPEIDTIEQKSNKTTITILPNYFSWTTSNMVKRTNADYKEFEEKLTSYVKSKGVSIEKTNYRALPDDPKKFTEMFIDDVKLKNVHILKNRIAGLVSYFPDIEGLMPKLKPTIFHKNKMSDRQLNKYIDKREDEKSKESKRTKKDDEDVASSYRIHSRLACHTIYPKEVEQVRPGYIEEDVDENDPQVAGLVPFFNALDTSDYFTNLKEYSPKYHELFNQVDQRRESLQLIYSQFLTIEGIGVFSKVLQSKGYVEFKLKKSSTWEVDVDPKLKDRPMYVTYIGTKTMEEKELIRNIFNKKWDVVPEHIKEAVQDFNLSIFIITSAGAEGISLKNVQYVHIMEPYWNQIRSDQVIGRARRICSHNTLPNERDRFVEVHMYISILPDDVPDGILTSWDKGLSTEEYLYELSDRKKKINSEILNCLRLSSIDCHLYDPTIKIVKTKDHLKLAYYADIQEDDTTEQVELNVKQTKLKKIKIKDTQIMQFNPSIKDSDGYSEMYFIDSSVLCGYTKDDKYYKLDKTSLFTSKDLYAAYTEYLKTKL